MALLLQNSSFWFAFLEHSTWRKGSDICLQSALALLHVNCNAASSNTVFEVLLFFPTSGLRNLSSKPILPSQDVFPKDYLPQQLSAEMTPAQELSNQSVSWLVSLLLTLLCRVSVQAFQTLRSAALTQPSCSSSLIVERTIICISRAKETAVWRERYRLHKILESLLLSLAQKLSGRTLIPL